LNETSVLSHPAGYQGGSFVDFPTKVGAFFQWGMNTGANITYAYHPTNPPSGPVAGWETDSYSGGSWDNIKSVQETCPNDWRRPNDGITNASQGTAINTTDYTANNIYKSEIRQSLYAVPKNAVGSMTETTGRAWGYYADGYFDRRRIGNSANGIANSAVSASTKDAAYIGTLFFNDANGNRSLFAPAGGSRRTGGGRLNDSGSEGFLWSSSGIEVDRGWYLYILSSEAYQYITASYYGFAVRCVSAF
jgi:hypothetical protein